MFKYFLQSKIFFFIFHSFTVKSGKLGKYDQIVVYLAMKIFHESPGMTGLCISAAYSATLSTLSTGLNSFATVAFKVDRLIQFST